MFEEYVSIIQHKYPNMAVDGQNYDPPGFNMFLSRLIVNYTLCLHIQILKIVYILGYYKNGYNLLCSWRN